MKISTSLSTKSISNAIKELEKEKRKLDDIVFYFLIECCDWFMKRANQHLENSDIGKNVVKAIQESWKTKIEPKDDFTIVATLTNTNEHASFVEFGVGSVGKSIPHPNVPYNYDYDRASDHKFTAQDGYDYWIYYVENLDDVDMHDGYILRPLKGYDHKVSLTEQGVSGEGGFWIITRGSWREMYAFNTLLDLKNEPQVIKGLWKKVKQKFWG